jgi:hypothetical protein
MTDLYNLELILPPKEKTFTVKLEGDVNDGDYINSKKILFWENGNEFSTLDFE